jgi:hypothetical protein
VGACGGTRILIDFFLKQIKKTLQRFFLLAKMIYEVDFPKPEKSPKLEKVKKKKCFFFLPLRLFVSFILHLPLAHPQPTAQVFPKLFFLSFFLFTFTRHKKK